MSSAADVLDPEVALEDEFSDSDDDDDDADDDDDDLGEEENMAECCSDDGMSMSMGMGIGAVVKDGEMIERYDKHELLISQQQQQQQEVDGMDTTVTSEPYEGMEFDSEDSARAFYYDYASHTGFRVRVSRCQRSVRDGTIICRRFVCSREGFYMHKDKGKGGSTKRQPTVTRVGCMAMLLVRKQSHGRWLVTKFVKEHNHNHDPAPANAPPRKMDLKPYVIMKAKKLEDSSADKEWSVAEAKSPPQRNRDLEPCEGMEFQSVEAAQMFYYAYAKDMGFTVRISKCRRARDGSIICRRFVCSKEGYYVRKYGRTKRSRALTRVGCLARLIVKRLDSGIWVVANFDKEHNHPPFVVGQELSYQPPKPTRHINRGAPASLPASSGSLQKWIDPDLQSSDNSVTWRFNKLHQEGIRFAEEGATSVEIFNVAMLALREATQKVVDAKSNALMTPMLDNLVSSSNHGVNTNQVNWALVNNSGNQATPGNQQCSNDGRQAGSPNGVMLMQQPVNLALFASGLPSEAGQVPSAINLPNGWAVHGGLDNQQINSAVPVAAQKQQLPDEHSSDGNVSFGSGMSEGRKQNYKTAEDDMENFITLHDYSEGDSKQDGVATLPQGGNIIGMGQTGTNTRSSGNSMNLTLSEAQLAALQAVAEAFNVPTVGATSSSALPIKVLPVPDQFSEGNKGCSALHDDTCRQSFEMLPDQEPLETPKTPSGPNPLVHAAAIAAGARIAPPSVAASLIKAVQSRTAVHVRPGGSSTPRVPVVSGGRGGDSLSPLTGVHQNSNIHYFRNREPHPPSMPLLCTGGLAEPGAHQLPLTKEGSGLQTSLASAVEQTDLSNVGLEDDPTMMMYHCMDLAEQQT